MPRLRDSCAISVDNLTGGPLSDVSPRCWRGAWRLKAFVLHFHRLRFLGRGPIYIFLVEAGGGPAAFVRHACVIFGEVILLMCREIGLGLGYLSSCSLQRLPFSGRGGLCKIFVVEASGGLGALVRPACAISVEVICLSYVMLGVWGLDLHTS